MGDVAIEATAKVVRLQRKAEAEQAARKGEKAARKAKTSAKAQAKIKKKAEARRPEKQVPEPLRSRRQSHGTPAV
ncbi:hypothetical protein EES43_15785 [Streptomyces sp. ADI96-02]|uniref:hypothetical protein n=1 Tax=Streptomyces sp. ADI96-02 TaxID=1522760 RepID=UPI000F551408|nr:hypothetical protein [Streptomyces sp. ADI96-02]RPK61284.1 hypothetical protein EES43_15785 [Streptomyces sp. ADI96-02]